MQHDLFFHIQYDSTRQDNNYNRLWKIRILFDQLQDTYAIFYNSS